VVKRESIGGDFLIFLQIDWRAGSERTRRLCHPRIPTTNERYRIVVVHHTAEVQAQVNEPTAPAAKRRGPREGSRTKQSRTSAGARRDIKDTVAELLYPSMGKMSG